MNVLGSALLDVIPLYALCFILLLLLMVSCHEELDASFLTKTIRHILVSGWFQAYVFLFSKTKSRSKLLPTYLKDFATSFWTYTACTCRF